MKRLGAYTPVRFFCAEILEKSSPSETRRLSSAPSGSSSWYRMRRSRKGLQKYSAWSTELA